MEKLILLVDDDEMYRELMLLHLLRLGYANVDTANGVESACELLKKTRYNLIISDTWIPKEDDGLRLLRAVRDSGNKEFQLTPFILMSSDMNPELEERAMALDADACIAKGSSSRELFISTVDRLISTTDTEV